MAAWGIAGTTTDVFKSGVSFQLAIFVDRKLEACADYRRLEADATFCELVVWDADHKLEAYATFCELGVCDAHHKLEAYATFCELVVRDACHKLEAYATFCSRGACASGYHFFSGNFNSFSRHSL